MPLHQPIESWERLRASIQEALHHHPNANLVIAATCKVYLAELMGSDRERSNERQLRDMTRALCRDVGLRVANAGGVPTQRSGSCIDIVLASRSLIVEDLLVMHDGDTCSCLPDAYHPIRSSDHTLIIVKVATSPSADDVGNVPWPRMRHCSPIIRHLQRQLLQWAQKLVELRQGQSPVRRSACCA